MTMKSTCTDRPEMSSNYSFIEIYRRRPVDLTDRRHTENNTHDSHIEVGSKSTHMIETYLNDLFSKEIEFKIDREEIEFIQLGVESLIQNIADLIFEHASDKIDKLQRRDRDRIFSVTGIPLIERETKQRILKVGSYYEKTKNTFPDEFDFIFILQSFEIDENHREKIYESAIPIILIGIHAVMGELLDDKEIVHSLKHTGTGFKGHRTVMFEKVVKLAGPALKLQFKYRNFNMEETEIDVDLVPAYEIYDQSSENRMNDICQLPEFRRELLRFGRYYFVKDNMTFTETELYFMTKVLSAKHVKVYRLLKFLMNGHTDGAELEEECSNQEVIYVHIASYKIKVSMIYHHFSCCHGDVDTVSQCVLEVMSTLAKNYVSRDWPRLVRKLNRPHIGKYINHNKNMKYRTLATRALKTLHESLMSLEESEKPYMYEDTCIPPFAKSLLQEIRDCQWPESSDMYVCLG